MTGAAFCLSAGAAAVAVAWLIPRRVAGARMAVLPAILLDLTPVLLAAGLLLIISGRPLFSGAVVLALGGGFAFADRTKRRVLREPVVFSDMSEFGHLFTSRIFTCHLPGRHLSSAVRSRRSGRLLGCWSSPRPYGSRRRLRS